MIGENVKLNSVAYTCACSLIGVLPALVVALMGAVRAAVRVTGSSADACGRWLTKQTMRCFFWSTVHRTLREACCVTSRIHLPLDKTTSHHLILTPHLINNLDDTFAIYQQQPRQNKEIR